MKKDIDLLSFNESSKTYDLTWHPNKSVVRGRERLVHQIMKRFLTLKGSNVFEPGFGENFYNLYGVIDIGRAQEVKETFPVLVKNVEEDIKNVQIKEGITNIEKSERLKSLDLVKIDFDEVSGAWIVEIKVITGDLVGSNIVII